MSFLRINKMKQKKEASEESKKEKKVRPVSMYAIDQRAIVTVAKKRYKSYV